MPFSIVPLLLLIVPMAEIAAFVIVGREIGVLWTLALIFVTAVLGSILLRVQGFGLINKIRRETEAGRVPGRELVHGVMILIAGVLLLTPGFITDTIGFLLFVPAIRDAGWTLIKNKISVVSTAGFTQHSSGPGPKRSDAPTIDLDEQDFERDPDPNSPWNKDKP
ncbi:FxsA family protein [Hoeflea sp. TYP-13]|uniref:FxsA family protein n=1 Tax=Hoeflea sp. TYP-13 TaxID=3230023 RepID=UPI0034C6C67E